MNGRRVDSSQLCAIISQINGSWRALKRRAWQATAPCSSAADDSKHFPLDVKQKKFLFLFSSLSLFFIIHFFIFFFLLLLFRKWVQKTSEAMIQFPKIHRKQISKTWRLRSLSTLNRFRIFHWAVTVFEEKCALMMGNNAIDWLEQVEEKDDLDNTWTVIGWSRLNHWDIKSCEPAGRSESFPAQSTVVEE